MDKNEISKIYDEAYRKIEVTKRDIADVINDFEELQKIQNHLNNNKYQSECFISILRDLRGMKGFINAFEFILENKSNFTK
jgi:hypothetical protein